MTEAQTELINRVDHAEQRYKPPSHVPEFILLPFDLMKQIRDELIQPVLFFETKENE